MTYTIKIATFNIGGILLENRIRQLLSYCKEGGFDLVALQEVKFSRNNLLESHFDVIYNLGPHRLGTAILVKRGISFSRELLEPDGRLISIDVGSFTFINIYAPSGSDKIVERNDFFRRTIPAYAGSSSLPLILVGDFNCVDNYDDRLSNNPANSSTPLTRHINKALIELTTGFELVDIWLKLNPSDLGHTFHHHSGSSRIDRVYSSRCLASSFSSACLRTLSVSDHFPVESTLTTNLLPPKKSNFTCLWKLNISILNEERFQKMVHDFVESSCRHPLRTSGAADWWETVFKPGIKRLAIGYCTKRARLMRETRRFYQDCLQEVVNSEPLDWPAFRELRSVSRAWEASVLQGYGVRSRAWDDSETEIASVFHVKKARLNFRNSCIEKVKDPSGNILSSEKEVDGEIVRHFVSIFKETLSPDVALENHFLDGVRGSCPDVPHLTSPITSLDIKTALLKTKKNKSPGTDGLPFEFYIAFWDVIAPHFLDMFHHVLERDSLSPSQGRAAVRLIPKVAGVCGVSSYRPISLLNTDYKLMASVLACRLKSTLKYTISPSQKGGVPGRLLSDNLCLYRDVIQYVNDRSKPEQHTNSRVNSFGGGIIGVDLEKAYDLVNRNVLWGILGAMGYPATFIHWLKVMYSVADMSILNGSRVAGDVTGVQSVRQGCPLSVHLYVLYVEPLLVQLTRKINGFNFHGQRLQVRAYVDDITIFTSCDRDVALAGEELEKFCQWTKSRVNKTKTKALGMGSWRDRASWPLPWLTSAPTLTLLGVPFSTCIAETGTRLWEKAHDTLIGTGNQHFPRKMSLFNRVRFIKSHILSKTVYIAQVFPCPKDISDKILSYIVSFTWHQFFEKPQRAPCYRHPTQGGIALPHPETFFQCLFLKPIYNTLIGPDSPERSLLRYWMSFPLRNTTLNIYAGNSIPCAVIERPSYIEEPVHHIKNLLASGTITPDGRLMHRQVYNIWISKLTAPGKTEQQYPHLDWNSIWKKTAALPAQPRETFFLFN